ncbi:PREDICTED: E3 ubiquitin-protein ligase SINA-like 7 [Nicotiana attenuata]|uniref:RING-type E3 ubiquitin transferase n=1 Tax=Nicotiana attenuata TaxID=49451 RepID=A0A1J6IKX6_NICAT|nr:PREDICTED: E3 ubiquitin-protein ligase SINA-like 7 [Nicotiana attenuata]OIT04948.1 e3 ubiquitin-protein ligase sina-like 10 [Nicotiana attenuata]
MKRVNHRPLSCCQIRSEEEEEKMVRFSLGREEDDNNEEGPSSRSVPKKRRTYGGTFSCNAVNRQQEQQQQEPERRCEVEETAIEEEEEEEEEEDIYEEEDFVTDEEREEEEENWNPESEPESEGIPDPGLNRSNNTVAVLNPDRDLEASRGNGSISVTLSDPDVLDCPICLEPLSTPVFQCENGHIACASCCIKIANKCPSCCWPIGYNRCRAIEKVLESVKVSCMNKIYGCKEILSYGKKTDHENTCTYVPCTCPCCDFTATSTKVYAHFRVNHGSLVEQIVFNAHHPIYVEYHHTCKYLQERTEGVIFIINHISYRLGSAVNIICIEPNSEERRFGYELVVTNGESSFKLESVAESMPKFSQTLPLKKFLLVPTDVVDSSAKLKLDVFIKQREYGINI